MKLRKRTLLNIKDYAREVYTQACNQTPVHVMNLPKPPGVWDLMADVYEAIGSPDETT